MSSRIKHSVKTGVPLGSREEVLPALPRGRGAMGAGKTYDGHALGGGRIAGEVWPHPRRKPPPLPPFNLTHACARPLPVPLPTPAASRKGRERDERS